MGSDIFTVYEMSDYNNNWNFEDRLQNKIEIRKLVLWKSFFNVKL